MSVFVLGEDHIPLGGILAVRIPWVQGNDDEPGYESAEFVRTAQLRWQKQGQKSPGGGPHWPGQELRMSACVLESFRFVLVSFATWHMHSPERRRNGIPVSWMESLLLPEPGVREVRHSRWLAVCFGLKQVFLPIFWNHHQPPLPQTPPLAPWSLLSLALSSTSPPLSTLFLKNTSMVSASITWNYRGWWLWCPCSPYGNSGCSLASVLQLLYTLLAPRASLIAQSVKNLPAKQETWVRFLGQKYPLEKGMATHSSILAWRSPWAEEPGRF